MVSNQMVILQLYRSIELSMHFINTLISYLIPLEDFQQTCFGNDLKLRSGKGISIAKLVIL